MSTHNVCFSGKKEKYQYFLVIKMCLPWNYEVKSEAAFVVICHQCVIKSYIWEDNYH